VVNVACHYTYEIHNAIISTFLPCFGWTNYHLPPASRHTRAKQGSKNRQVSCGFHWSPPSFESIHCRSGRLDIGLANDMSGSNPTSNAPWPRPGAITTGRVYWETCHLASQGCTVPSVEVCAALAKCHGSISIPARVEVTFGNPHPEPPKLVTLCIGISWRGYRFRRVALSYRTFTNSTKLSHGPPGYMCVQLELLVIVRKMNGAIAVAFGVLGSAFGPLP